MLGDLLREERERQNLTIKDIEDGTSIRRLYLSSIEEGKYEVIPGEVFLKGFIKAYAGFLNLDGAAMLKLYYEEKNSQMDVPDSAISKLEPEKVEDIEPREIKSIKEIREEKKKNSPSDFPVKTVAGVLICLCVGGAGYFFFFGPDEADKSVTKTVAVVPKEEKKPKAVVEPPKPMAKPAEATPISQNVDITAVLIANCWTKVESDGKVIFEGTLKSGDKLQWKADRELKITAGNAGGMEIVLNGESIGKLGNAGEVMTKTFAKDAAVVPKQ